MLGVIGDVHCEDRYLDLAIETLRAENVQEIVCTGDLPTGQGNINACCDLLRKNKIRTVRGNHDRWLLNLGDFNLPFATHPGEVTKSSWKVLESLPEMIDLLTPVGIAQLCHGIGRDDMTAILPEDPDEELENHLLLRPIIDAGRYRLMINGHSHHRMVRRFKSLTIINAGTLRRDHKPCFGLIDFERSLVRYWDILDQETAIQSDEFALP